MNAGPNKCTCSAQILVQAIGNQYEGKNILVLAHGEVRYRTCCWDVIVADPLQAQEELCIMHL